MVHKLICLLTLFLLSYCFSFGQQKNDLELKHLQGKVKSVNEISYVAKIKGDEILNGKRERKDSWDKDKLFLFNEYGYITQKQEYNSKGKPTNLCTYSYDSYNNVISKVTLFENKSTKTDLDSNVYDTRGYLILQYCCSSEATFFCSDFVLCRSYKYDESGNEIQLTLLNPTNGDYISRHTYIYDNNHNITEMSSYNSGDTLAGTITYKYSESNRLIEENHFDSNNEPLWSHSYIRNEQGDLIKMVITFFKTSPISTLSFTYVYEYDAQNNWVKKIYYKEGVPIYILERTIEYYE